MDVIITRDGKTLGRFPITSGDIDGHMTRADWERDMRAEAIRAAVEDGIFTKESDADDCEFEIVERD